MQCDLYGKKSRVPVSICPPKQRLHLRDIMCQANAAWNVYGELIKLTRMTHSLLQSAAEHLRLSARFIVTEENASQG